MATDENEKLFIQSFSDGNWSEAIRFSTVLIELDPSSSVHFTNRAACHEKLELYRKCIKDCDSALELAPDNLNAYLIKGRALWSMNKKAEATKVWKLGSQRYGSAELVSQLYNFARGNLKALFPATESSASVSTTPAVEVSPITPPTTSSPPPPRSVSPVATPMYQQQQQQPPQAPQAEDDEVLHIDTATAKTASDISNMSPKNLEALLGIAAQGMIQHGVGNRAIDQQIALGYLQVNTGNFENAIRVFNQLLQVNPKVVAAYLGRGTAYALMGDLDNAARDFSLAIDIDPKCVDAYKRRGQTRAARGMDQDGLADLNMALEMQKDHESYHQRGLIHYKLRNYKRALEDFQNASKLDHSNKATWNHMGLCNNAMGNSASAVEAHLKALSLDNKYKEAIINLGQAYKDWGKATKAMEQFNRAVSVDPQSVGAHHCRALLWFGLGRHNTALEDFTRACQRDPRHWEARWMRAVTLNGLGQIRASLRDYDEALSMKPDHWCWFQKEIALYWHHRLDTPLEDYNMDQELDPVFKEFWCKRQQPSSLPNKAKVSQPPVDPSIADIDYDEHPASYTPETWKLLELAWDIGKLLHQEAPGFLFNRRQLKMAGLAAVEVAQKLRSVWAGAANVAGKTSSGIKHDHKFGWRDMYDISVRWRQISEPNDPVWWVDQLTPEQFSEGFGSHTPIITGQCNVVRYGPMFPRALGIMKRLMREQCVLTDAAMEKIEKAKTCEELYSIMRRDFWVVTPCHSERDPKKIMEGTRLTLQFSPPEGYEYSIRTPGTPPRWIDYDLELEHAFEMLSAEAQKANPDLEVLSKWILTSTFYWYNFMPLSRGSAATGYVCLLGMFLAVGVQITAKIPPTELIDWDGILLPTSGEFINTFSRWLYPMRSKVDLAVIDALPKVSEVFGTLRKSIQALNSQADNEKRDLAKLY